MYRYMFINVTKSQKIEILIEHQKAENCQWRFICGSQDSELPTLTLKLLFGYQRCSNVFSKFTLYAHIRRERGLTFNRTLAYIEGVKIPNLLSMHFIPYWATLCRAKFNNFLISEKSYWRILSSDERFACLTTQVTRYFKRSPLKVLSLQALFWELPNICDTWMHRRI